MEVRPLNSPAEFHQAERLIGRAWRVAFDDIVSEAALREVESQSTHEELLEQYDRISTVQRSCSLVAIEDELLGVAWAVWDDDITRLYVGPDHAELRLLYVDPDHWGEGIGSTLLDTCLERLPPSIDTLLLETFEANELGRSFYDAHGFSVVDTATFEVADELYPTVVYARAV